MGIFDFLDDLGDSKKDFKKIKLDIDLEEKVKYLEILQSRNLIMENFKNDLIEKYINKEIDEKLFKSNVDRSIKLHNDIELQLIDIDENEFKLKNDELEYIGSIDRINDDDYPINPNKGMVSYNFVKKLFSHLNWKTIKLKEINDLSDILDFKVLKCFNVKQKTPKNI
jgi:hypothetical protein